MYSPVSSQSSSIYPIGDHSSNHIKIFDVRVIKESIMQQIQTLGELDPAKAERLSQKVITCNWNGPDIDFLRSQGLHIDPHFQPLVLLGGMMEEESTATPPFLTKLTSAMREGGLFSAANGRENATGITCKMSVGSEEISGTYTGPMSKVRLNGNTDSWVPFGEGEITLVNGSSYKGRWKYGIFCNYGIFKSTQPAYCYKGSWEEGLRNGYGMLVEFNHAGVEIVRYEGHWKNELFDGSGIYYNDKGEPIIGYWEAGILKHKRQSQTVRERIVSSITTTEELVIMVPELKKLITDPVVNAKLVSSTGLERNNLMAEAMKKAGLLEQIKLPFANHPAEFKVYSYDTSRYLPMKVASEWQSLNLKDVTLPSEIHHRNALEWLKAHAGKFEAMNSKEDHLPLRSLKSLPIKRLVIGVGVPINPGKNDSEKSYRGEFSPGILRWGNSKNNESWGFIAWANNGVQSANGSENGPGGSIYKVMTENREKGSAIRQGWGLQSIDVNEMSSLQAATIRTSIEKNLAHALHIIAFRFIETPKTSRQNDANETPTPEIGTLVPGEHKESDNRGLYSAHVYRRFDPESVVMITLVASPVNLRQDKITENQLKLSIQSHIEVLDELVSHAQANKSI